VLVQKKPNDLGACAGDAGSGLGSLLLIFVSTQDEAVVVAGAPAALGGGRQEALLHQQEPQPLQHRRGSQRKCKHFSFRENHLCES